MFTQPRIIRCKNCKRPFSDYADHCPECQTKTPRGWIGLVFPVVCVLVAIIVIALTLYMVSRVPTHA